MTCFKGLLVLAFNVALALLIDSSEAESPGFQFGRKHGVSDDQHVLRSQTGADAGHGGLMAMGMGMLNRVGRMLSQKAIEVSPVKDLA